MYLRGRTSVLEARRLISQHDLAYCGFVPLSGYASTEFVIFIKTLIMTPNGSY